MAPEGSIWITSQIHQDKNFQNFVWDKIIQIMERENEIRVAEVSTYVYNFGRLII